jgi:biopolymer transport protein TolR
MKISKRPEINVTPLVDVMLVLLVIFMVATPIIQNEIDVNLPVAKTSKEASQKQNLKLTIMQNKIFINDKEVDQSDLPKLLDSFSKDDPIFLRADKEVNCQRLAQIFAVLEKIGFRKIAFITKNI